MSNYSLLVADDEEIPRRHILEDISWDTLNIRPLYQASTGWEALALLLKHQPDILILDIRMPGASIRPAALTTRSLWKSPDRNLLLFTRTPSPAGARSCSSSRSRSIFRKTTPSASP